MEASRRSFLWRIAVRVLALFALISALGLLITQVLGDIAPISDELSVNESLAADRTPTGDSVSHFFSMLASTPVIIGLLLVTVLVFRLVYHRWRESVFLFLAVGTQTLVFLGTALVVRRDRPNVEPMDVAPPTSSFPSGHTGAATALFVGIALVVGWHLGAKWLRPLLIALALLVPIAVAYSRVYRGMHHTSDVAASFVSGGLVIFIYARQVLFGVLPDAWARWLDGDSGDGIDRAVDNSPVPA